MAKEIQIKLNVDDSQLQNAAGSADNLRKQLREASIDLENTVAKFGLTSQEAAKAAQKVGELRDTLGDARALAAAFDADKKFAAVGQALTGVLGGFTAVQGALAAFGVESEDVQKSLLKIQGLLAFTQGINQLLAAQDAFKNLGVVIQTTSGIQKLFATTTVATSTALNAVGVSSTAASVGVRAFSSALIATGIGALVVGLGLAVSALIDFIDNTAEATAANAAFTKSLELVDVGLNGELRALKRNGAERIAQAKAIGASASELNKITNDNITGEIESLQRAQKERTDIYNKALKDRNLNAKDFSKISDDYTKGEIETTARIRDLQSQQRINNFAVQEGIRKDNEAAGAKRAAQRKQDREKAQREADQFAEKQKQTAADVEKMILEAQRTATKALLDDEAQRRLEIQFQRDDDLAKLKANLDAKLITQEQYLKAVSAVNARYTAQDQVITNEAKEKADEKAEDDRKKALDKAIEDADALLNIKITTIDNEFAAKQRKLEEQRAAETITDVEYNTQKTALDFEAATQREAALTSVVESSGQYKAEIQKNFADQSNELAQATADTQTAITVNASEQQVAIEQSKQEALRQLQDLTIGNIAALGNLLGQFGEESKGLAIAAIVIEQGTNIAKIVIDTQREIAGYFASYSAIPFAGPGIAAGLATAAKIRAGLGIATAVAAAATGISKIKSANKKSSGGGGGGASLGGAGTSVPKPSVPNIAQAAAPTVGLSAANPNLAIQQSIAGAQQRPVQAYVVSTQVTSQQALDRRRRGNGVQNSSDAPVQTALSTGG
jgi:hypothetical protein